MRKITSIALLAFGAVLMLGAGIWVKGPAITFTEIGVGLAALALGGACISIGSKLVTVDSKPPPSASNTDQIERQS